MMMLLMMYTCKTNGVDGDDEYDSGDSINGDDDDYNLGQYSIIYNFSSCRKFKLK